MRNAGYQSSFTSQICNYGSNEIQMPLPAFSDISLNLCGGSSLFSESHVNSDHQHFGSFGSLSSMECPESFDAFHVPGWLTNTTTASSMAASGPILSDTAAVEKENARKRKFEYESREGKMKNKSICMEDRRLCLPYKEQSPTGTEAKKGPVKRSQKISDKITVLQKLVSPFGKTDTASVLQEAHSYIKYLQEQIEIFAAPYFLRPLHSQGIGRSVDLHSRGLSLVPVSVTKSLSKDNQIAHCAARRPSFNMKL